MKPFLVIQLRPEAEVADDEYAAILRRSGLTDHATRRIRLDRETLPDGLDLSAFSGVIVGGGPGCVSDPPEAKTPMEARIEAQILSLMPRIAESGTAFLGCCYGIGILGRFLGAPVSQDHHGEDVGAIICRRRPEAAHDPLLNGLPDQITALVGHKEALDALPHGAVHLLEGECCPIQMLRYGDRIYATQFHPEADGANFALRIAVYKNKGYFAPERAAELTAACADIRTEASGRVLANFVHHFARD
ncbi:MAG: GMP synthase (glutamine-hydrolysing) [Roseibaca calidilacus]|uniref:GMP synthase (Glutamine-hydrolysing) n=1 Tax=Roseibaca calidilacus TaxID=1666912 RepID=A0A0P7WP67_9RHOB|nr:glutamine amidotransferase [Roseibaca calidilacus]KPP95789.1 MAG: GMP synthase (glutamine-hydrolysing) [Roseibaca calidilacus]CUX81705.1 GMP synthase (glutamine-hydrolysing) [Roseibaca calidilacus]